MKTQLACISLALGALSVQAQTLAHRYSFTTDASDSVGNADFTLQGTASVTGGELELPGGAVRTHYASAEGASLTELAGTINGASVITIESWFSSNTPAANEWSKLFMAGDRDASGSDHLIITPRRRASGFVLTGQINEASVGSGDLNGPNQVPFDGTESYVSVTWDVGNNLITINQSLDGSTINTTTGSMGGATLAGLNIADFYLGAAQGFGDTDLFGSINEFRIWEGELDSDDIAYHLEQGANGAVVPEPGSLALIGLAGIAYLLTRRRK